MDWIIDAVFETLFFGYVEAIRAVHRRFGWLGGIAAFLAPFAFLALLIGGILLLV
ncbi:MAG: hypothetical protein ABW169_00110 [Sphingobium sp.]